MSRTGTTTYDGIEASYGNGTESDSEQLSAVDSDSDSDIERTPVGSTSESQIDE